MRSMKCMRGVLMVLAALGLTSVLWAQEPPVVPPVKSPESAPVAAPENAPRVARQEIIVPSGTKVPLSMVNSVSSRTARAGDPVFLRTMFPVFINGHLVIPVGSYVRGTITDVKRSGRVKGRAEMYIRFDSLTLPNGTTRDFNAVVSNEDAQVPGKTREGKIEAEGTKGRDAATIAETGATGTAIGAIAGSASGHPGVGTAIGAGAGAIAGLIVALAQRGNEITLLRGSEVDMTLDRNLVFDEGELTGLHADADRYDQPPARDLRNGRSPGYYDQYGRRRLPY